MDRKQEYDALTQELRQTPPALDGTLDRALERRRTRRAARTGKRPCSVHHVFRRIPCHHGA